MNKNIFLLWQGQLVSQLGTQAFSIVMMFWLMQHTGSSLLMSVVLTLSILPSILLSPISGVVADRFSRKKIIITADLVRGVFVLTLALSFLFNASEKIIVMLFAVTALINGICRAFFQPAINAWIPDFISKEKLPRTIALFSSSEQFSSIIGQALGGVLYKILGAPLLLLFDALSYLFSAFTESFIQTDANKNLNKNEDKPVTSYKTDLLEGFNYVKKQEGMIKTMLFAASINFFVAPIMLLLPFYISEQLATSVNWYGFLLAAMALGSLVGFWVSSTIEIIKNRRSIIMFSAMFMVSGAFFLLSQSTSSIYSLVLMFIFGSGLGLFNLQTMTLFQTCTPSFIRGRVMSLLMGISSSFLPLGLIIGGLLGTLTNNNTQVIFALSALSIAISTVYFMLSTKVKRFLQVLPS